MSLPCCPRCTSEIARSSPMQSSDKTRLLHPCWGRGARAAPEASVCCPEGWQKELGSGARRLRAQRRFCALGEPPPRCPHVKNAPGASQHCRKGSRKPRQAPFPDGVAVTGCEGAVRDRDGPGSGEGRPRCGVRLFNLADCRWVCPPRPPPAPYAARGMNVRG